jgi:hypothetical protein
MKSHRRSIHACDQSRRYKITGCRCLRGAKKSELSVPPNWSAGRSWSAGSPARSPWIPDSTPPPGRGPAQAPRTSLGAPARWNFPGMAAWAAATMQTTRQMASFMVKGDDGNKEVELGLWVSRILGEERDADFEHPPSSRGTRLPASRTLPHPSSARPVPSESCICPGQQLLRPIALSWRYSPAAPPTARLNACLPHASSLNRASNQRHIAGVHVQRLHRHRRQLLLCADAA